jgi:hypothetical protein
MLNSNSASVTPTAGQVRQSIRQFNGYAHDLMRADSAMFADALRVFAHFCESDSAFSQIHGQLINNPDADFAGWAAKYSGPLAARSGTLRFPVEADQRISVMYQVLLSGAKTPGRLINNLRLWFRTGGPNVSGYIFAFSNAVLTPLFRDLGHRLREIEEQLPEEKTEIVTARSLQIFFERGDVHMPTNQFNFHNSQGIQIGDKNRQDLNITLAELIQRIDSSSATSGEKAEAKNRLQKFLEHPLVCAVAGGLAGTAATAAAT